jgi:hypothetical protein
MSNQAQPKARKGTNPERNPAKANKAKGTTPAAPLCVLCGDTIKPPVGMDGVPIDDPTPIGCNPEPLATKGRCCEHCDAWVVAARCGHSIKTGLRFVRGIRQRRNEAIAAYLASKKGGAK